MARYLKFVTLDVFTGVPFSGNPLAVVFLPDDGPSQLSQAQKQEIAREFNYSETIFVHPVEIETPNKQAIDIFMTDRELPFAGHPVIGAASWLLCLSPKERSPSPLDTIVTKAGEIPLSLSTTSAGEVSAMIPFDAHIHKTQFPLSELLRLHPTLVSVFSDDDPKNSKTFPVCSIVKDVSQILVELPNLAALEALTLAAGGETISSNSVAQGGYMDDGWEGDGPVVFYFYVRNVWDELTGKSVTRTRTLLGGLEDPATGSAASGLAAYLSLVDQDKAGRSYDYEFVQGVEMGRRSKIGVKLVLSEDRTSIMSIELSGRAVKISEGQILVKEES